MIPALFIAEAWQRHHLNQIRGSAIVGYTRDALGKVGQNVTLGTAFGPVTWCTLANRRLVAYFRYWMHKDQANHIVSCAVLCVGPIAGAEGIYALPKNSGTHGTQVLQGGPVSKEAQTY